MSFNYLEVARAVEIIAKELPLAVQAVEIVDFPLRTPFSAPLADLNVALRLDRGRTLVFSLKQPWTGIFMSDSSQWRASGATWASAMGGAQDWNPYLKGVELASITSAPGERVPVLGFSNGAELQIELFP